MNDFGFGLIVGTYTGAIVAGMEMHGVSWLYQAVVLFGLWFVGLMFVLNEGEVRQQ